MTTPTPLPVTAPETETTPARKPAARELLRFGIGNSPMPLERLRQLLEIAAPSELATIRIYNGSAIIEEPPAEETS